MENLNIPLPPLDEQKRIVTLLDSLFEKLDAAKEIAKAVIDSYELRRAAILHKAFTGELSEKWRVENGFSLDDWQTKKISDVCRRIVDGDHMPPPKTESGVPFLVISNVNKGKLNFQNTRFVSSDYYENLTLTRKPEFGDVLYTLVGSYGISVLVDTEKKFCFQRHIGILKPNFSKLTSKFLFYLMQNKSFFEQTSNIATGTAQLTVPIKKFRDLTINLPPLSEQKEIARLLDSLLGKEQRTKEIAEKVLQQIDALKKNILARAFRGELGIN